MEYVLYVDDTAFVKQGNSKNLDDEIVSIVGCLVAKPNVPALENEISNLSKELKDKYDVSEFHFTDMFNRRNGFEKLESMDSLMYMAHFAALVQAFDISIITQTITKSNLKKYKSLFDLYDIVIDKNNFAPKDNKRAEEYGLLLNITKANKFLKEYDEKDYISKVVCDEGIMRDGADVNLKYLYEEGLPICFKSSAKEKNLQVADFCAWGLSRTKQTMGKSQGKAMKPFELNIMRILENIVENYVNIDTVVSDVENGINIDKTIEEIAKDEW